MRHAKCEMRDWKMLTTLLCLLMQIPDEEDFAADSWEVQDGYKDEKDDAHEDSGNETRYFVFGI